MVESHFAVFGLAESALALPGLSRPSRDPLPVEISTATLPCTPALSVSLAGLKRQSAFAGSVPQEKANVAPEPAGEMTRVYVACCPLATVWLAEPVIATVKSNPVPESATVAGVETAEEVTVSDPEAEPPALG